MSKTYGLYKCNVCGNIVEMLHDGGGTLVCCGEDMELMKAKTEGAGEEKHVPVVEKVDGGIKVRLGSVPHPMTQEHRIEWIVVMSGNGVMVNVLKAGDPPEAIFPIEDTHVKAFAYCNLHGLWSN